MSCNIVVVGSCMVDFTSYAARLPKEGETIHGHKFVTSFGGKGANQCVAAAKLGGNTGLVARVGDDVWGEKYIQHLKDLSINTDFVQITPNITSGIAQINVADSGANQIVIIAAANQKLSVSDVDKAEELISKAEVIVCQLETSVDVALKAIELCQSISILNGAPAIIDYDERIFSYPTIFCVNESEASIFTGKSIESLSDAKIAVDILLQKGCQIVILTLGAEGALFKSKDCTSTVHVPSPVVQCIDSTGAGDAFIGALAFCIVTYKGYQLEDLIKAANYIAADSVKKHGTQTSYPGPQILEFCIKPKKK